MLLKKAGGISFSRYKLTNVMMQREREDDKRQFFKKNPKNQQTNNIKNDTHIKR